MLVMKRADTESTASIARLAAIIVSTASLATESPAAAAVAAFIHGAITRDMANFATYDQIFKRTYICSNRIRHCAFLHPVEDRLPAEDTPWRDGLFLRSDNKLYSLGVRDNRGKDVQPLVIWLAHSQENTPSTKGVTNNSLTSTSTRGGEGN
jgi:hypothetical protein